MVVRHNLLSGCADAQANEFIELRIS